MKVPTREREREGERGKEREREGERERGKKGGNNVVYDNTKAATEYINEETFFRIHGSVTATLG